MGGGRGGGQLPQVRGLRGGDAIERGKLLGRHAAALAVGHDDEALGIGLDFLRAAERLGEAERLSSEPLAHISGDAGGFHHFFHHFGFEQLGRAVARSRAVANARHAFRKIVVQGSLHAGRIQGELFLSDHLDLASIQGDLRRIGAGRLAAFLSAARRYEERLQAVVARRLRGIFRRGGQLKRLLQKRHARLMSDEGGSGLMNEVACLKLVGGIVLGGGPRDLRRGDGQ